MNSIKTTIKGRRLELDVPPDWPDGTEVEILPLDKDASATGLPMDREAWRRFIERTAGSINDPTFVRHPQGEFEERDPVAVKYLLDTNTCVQYLRYGNASPVAGKLAGANSGDVLLCSVVVGELMFGALRSQDIKKNIAEVQAFRSGFRSLPLDDAAAEEYANVRADLAAKGTPIGPNDMLIAAIALTNGLILVTHNTSELGRVVGLSLEDWQI